MADLHQDSQHPHLFHQPSTKIHGLRTLIITREGTPIPKEITPLFLRNQINAALPKVLIAEVRFTPNLLIQLIAVTLTTSNTLLKSRAKLEETIRTILPSATSLQKDVQVVQVVVHNIPTSILSASEGYLQVRNEVQSFNPGTTLHRTPRWLTRLAKRENNAASSMVLSIVGRPSATEALKGLLLFGSNL
ncbi:hypothetical protein Q9L58_010678 [Maublancomyces gigas]|uniref:Uncharacterized protein n=1 Tax=Discina gigas TaxID=1032678 RepID=A0ABR3G3W1_9PEZI